MALNLGGIIRLTYAVKNDLGAATNPSAATLTITQPDGTTATPSVTLPPVTTGLLLVDFTPAQSGLHSVRWATTGPTTAEDDVFVAEPPGRMLISVDEAVNHLGASGILTSDADREQLQWLCLVVSEAAEGASGRTFIRQTFSEVHDGGGSSVILRHTPILSVASVTASGVLVASTAYYFTNPMTGILHSGASWSRSWFTSGYGNLVVAYVAGYANPPKAARMVALTALQSLWQQSQQAPHPLLDEGAQFAVASAIAGLPDPLREDWESLKAVGIA